MSYENEYRKTHCYLQYAEKKAEDLERRGFTVRHCSCSKLDHCYMVVDEENKRFTDYMDSTTFNTTRRFTWYDGIPRKEHL